MFLPWLGGGQSSLGRLLMFIPWLGRGQSFLGKLLMFLPWLGGCSIARRLGRGQSSMGRWLRSYLGCVAVLQHVG